MLYGHE
jgi:serine/threonine protein kinase